MNVTRKPSIESTGASTVARALKDIEHEIRALEREEQEHLLRTLIEELDGPADGVAERAWLEEVQRRTQQLDSGTVTPIPAAEVLSTARAALRR